MTGPPQAQVRKEGAAKEGENDTVKKEKKKMELAWRLEDYKALTSRVGLCVRARVVFSRCREKLRDEKRDTVEGQ